MVLTTSCRPHIKGISSDAVVAIWSVTQPGLNSSGPDLQILHAAFMFYPPKSSQRTLEPAAFCKIVIMCDRRYFLPTHLALRNHSLNIDRYHIAFNAPCIPLLTPGSDTSYYRQKPTIRYIRTTLQLDTLLYLIIIPGLLTSFVCTCFYRTQLSSPAGRP